MSLKNSKHPKVNQETRWYSRIKKELKIRTGRTSRRISKQEVRSLKGKELNYDP